MGGRTQHTLSLTEASLIHTSQTTNTTLHPSCMFAGHAQVSSSDSRNRRKGSCLVARVRERVLSVVASDAVYAEVEPQIYLRDGASETKISVQPL